MTARYLTRIEPGPRLVITDTRPSSPPGCSEREWWMDLPCQLEWSRQRDLFGGITGSARLLVHGADRTESFAGTDDDLWWVWCTRMSRRMSCAMTPDAVRARTIGLRMRRGTTARTWDEYPKGPVGS